MKDLLSQMLKKLVKNISKKVAANCLPTILKIKHIFCLSQSVEEVDIVAEFLSKANDDLDFSHCIDIGFHAGNSSRCFLKYFAGVLAFEPFPEVFKKTSKFILENPNLDLRCQAISPEIGEAEFYLSTTSSGISSLSKDESLHQSSIKVQTTTLECALSTYRERDLRRFCCIKIDVEGYEEVVLRQISELDELRPSVIISEFQDLKSGFGDLKRQLTIGFKMGYYCVLSLWKPVARYGCAHEWDRFIPIQSIQLADPICSYVFSGWGNAIFIKPEFYKEFISYLSSYELRKKQ